MTCPPDVAAAIAEILQIGLLRVRATAWAGEGVAAEADHLHNLPVLLRQFDYEALRTYWSIERPAYLRRSRPEASQAFAEPWERLAKWLDGYGRLSQIA